jgi:imidazolonepropionase-like amidohydrolase
MKLKLILTFAIAAGLTGCGSSGDSPKKALVGATLIDGTGGPAVAQSVVVIEGGTISAAGPEASTPVPDGFTKINVSGKFMVPGLIDAHVVLDSDAEKAASQLKAFLKAGVTAIGADTKVDSAAPRVFPSLDKQAGIADLVIASNGKGPEATMAKIERMAKAEIGSLQILQAATKNSGTWLGQPKLGSIGAGQRADLLLLNADPVVDIKNLRQIYRVMVDGHWVEGAAAK